MAKEKATETAEETKVEATFNEVEETDEGLQLTETSVGVTDSFITKERVWALIRALCILVSTVAALFGFSVDADVWFNIITTACMFGSMGWGYWKNNNWTELANLAQSLLNALKGNKSEE